MLLDVRKRCAMCMFHRISLSHVKEPAHYSKRVGDVFPGVVVYLRHLHVHHHSSWVGRVQWAHTL